MTGGEFDLIGRLIGVGWRGSRQVLLGPGDDAAVLRGGIVLSTDVMVEGIHFRPGWITEAELGFRAVAAGLSDLAAMGAEPLAVLLSIVVPGRGEAAVAIQEGAAEAADRAGATVVGGDLSRSPGPVVVDVVSVGRTQRPVLRSGARPGQDVWLSGALGGAAWAVTSWEAGDVPEKEARHCFARPPDRTRLGIELGKGGLARAMIDVSDGLGADLGHVAAASNVGAVLRLPDVPVVPGLPGGLNRGLDGGEDYELLFAAESGSRGAIARLSAATDTPLHRIGQFVEGGGVQVRLADGRSLELEGGGFDHFTPRIVEG
ncbi:MAG: thiamine-phosphate kinase [Gemmatimonadota bacterium]|nr:thiamine-phosphate kinase [Gemmatimonadota bacterium]